MITETVYRNRDNTFSLELNANNSAVDITGLTRALLEFQDVAIDSANEAGAFDWSSNGVNGELEVDIGMLPVVALVPAGKYKSKITVFDATFPNGLIWDYLWLEVI
jgi:hypothetical protein